jgi:hypothetical protein
MYMLRSNPTTLDRNVEIISTIVALKAECACEGLRMRIAREIFDGAVGGLD